MCLQFIAATQHLQSERISIQSKIKDLQEELSLLDGHLDSQGIKVVEINGGIEDSQQQISLLKTTLEDIEREMEKAMVILEIPAEKPDSDSIQFRSIRSKH